MSLLRKTPITIITGFLGSGKTTLISKLIETYKTGRLAIIVNEFGDIGVDGDIIKSCAIPNCPAENIIELSNGCICCTVADDFIPTIDKILKLNPKPDHIIIETSGLALPKPLLKAFEWPEIRTQITVDGVIALADAEAVSKERFAPSPEALERQRLADENISHETPLSEVFEDQVYCSDLVLLTKTDIVTKDDLSKAKNIIKNFKNKEMPIIEIENGNIEPGIILGLESEAENDLLSRPSHHDGEDEHEHDDFENIVVNIDTINNQDYFLEKLNLLTSEFEILRTKGFVRVENKPMRLLIQGVGTRIRTQFDVLLDDLENRSGKLVFIAEKGKVTKETIEKYLLG